MKGKKWKEGRKVETCLHQFLRTSLVLLLVTNYNENFITIQRYELTKLRIHCRADQGSSGFAIVRPRAERQ